MRPCARIRGRLAADYSSMTVDIPTRRLRLFAWLTGAEAVLGLLLAAVLFVTLDDPRWGVLTLVLSTGLAGVFALFKVRSTGSNALGSAHTSTSESHVSRETGTGLPVYPTTGLYRSWIFRQRLVEEIARVRRYGRSLAVVLLEPSNLLDEPTPEGYALAAKALRHTLRAGDFAAQFDEERFVVLLPETGDEGAKAAGRRLLSSLRSSNDPQVRWRAALVTYPEDGTEPDALLDRALTLLRPGRLEGAVRATRQG